MIRVFRQRFSYFAAAALVPLALTGCSGHVIPPAGQTVSLHMRGKVHGGQQPVFGATIQLFDMSMQVGDAAAPLLNETVLSDANGGFSITNDFVCPNGTDQVYLAAVGGDPGGGTNDDLVMMTALGNCNDLRSSTFITINEVTTVATIWAYADGYDSSQTGGSNVDRDVSGAYQNFLNLVDPATGVAQTTNGTGVQLQVNALANSLSTCVNSATTGGDSPECDRMIQDAGTYVAASSDSSQVIYAIIIDPLVTFSMPGAVTAIFLDAPPSPPFQPTLTTAPSSWNLGFFPLS